MISNHLRATRDLEDAIKTLSRIVEQMPDGLPKYRLQIRIEMMQSSVQEYIKMSGQLYDQMVEFFAEAA